MPRETPDPSSLCDVYVDESSHTKHRYLTLGSLIVPTRRAAELDAAIWAARGLELPEGEMAWTKVSRTKLSAYKRVVETLLDRSILKHIYPLHFHMLAVDTSTIDDRSYNEGSRDDGFSKEVYQLCMKHTRLYPRMLFHLYLDQRGTKTPPEKLRTILNFSLRKKGDQRDWAFRRAHFRDSSRCLKIQLVDILLGAVAFHLNGHRAAKDASPAKCELSDLVLFLANIKTAQRDTAIAGPFTIWHRQMRPRLAGVPRP